VENFPGECRLPFAKSAGGGKERGPGGRHPDMPPAYNLTTPQALLVGNIDKIAFQANPNRRYLEIQNQSGVDWCMNFDAKAVQGFGLLIPSGSSKIFDSYTITKSEIHLIAYVGVFQGLQGVGIEGIV
jgi:hypothetical protein